MIKVLYLEDDLNFHETIVEFLEENDFDVTSTYNSEEVLNQLYENNFDILILDVNVPGQNGFDLLHDLRESNITTPAIFTTSLNRIDDLELGYKSGADDYLRKPFSLKELLLRINVLSKRIYNNKSNIINITPTIFYNINTQELSVDNEIVNLKYKEIELLKLLIQNKNQCVHFETIYDTVWSYDEVSSETSLRTYIKNLRKSLGKDTIVSIKKQGYKLVV